MRALLFFLLQSAALAGCGAIEPSRPAAPPVGIDLGGAAAAPRAATQTTPATPSMAHDHTSHRPSTAGSIPGHAVVEAIDPGRRRVTLAHDPMPEIGWPAMTMVFTVPSAIDLRRLKPGDHADFTLRKGGSGSYDLIDLRPGDH